MNPLLALLLTTGMLFSGGDARTVATIDQSVADARQAAIVAAASIVPEITPEEAAQVVSDAGLRFEHDWQVLYYAKLAGFMSDAPPLPPADHFDEIPIERFNILDLDGNGTPELLFSDGRYHGASGDLYIAREDGLVLLDRIGSYGDFQYDFERSYIRGAYLGQGASFTNIYRFEDGAVREVVAFYTFDGGGVFGPGFAIQINGQDVSESLYNAAYGPYSEESFVVGEGLLVTEQLGEHMYQYRPKIAENGYVVRNHNITPETVVSALLEFQA